MMMIMKIMMIMLMRMRISCIILFVIYYMISDDIQQISYDIIHGVFYQFEPAVGRRKSYKATIKASTHKRNS